MRSVVAALCVGLLLVGMISSFVPTVEAPPPPQQYYLAYHDAIGSVYRTFDGSSATYSKYPGDPNLLREYELGDLPDQESRGYWRFTIPDFTDKNVKDVKLEFRTRNAQCLPPPPCDGTLSFKTDVFRLYQNPNEATPQYVYDGIHEHQGLPYLKGSLGEFTLQAQWGYSVSLGPNAVADINHHEGGWYAIGMKIYEVRDGLNRLRWGRLEVCSLSSCAYPPPGPGSLGSKPGPTPLYALPVLKITYEAVTTWSQLHGDARHNGFSASAAPTSGNNVWHKTHCGTPPATCKDTDYSPVAKDGHVYTSTLPLVGSGSVIHAFEYDSTLVATKELAGPSVETYGGARSLAVSNDLLVKIDFWGPLPWTTTVRAFKPATDPADPLGSLWTYNLPGDEIGRAGATIYGRYVLVSTEGGSVDTYGHLYLLESRGSAANLIWTFTPPVQGDIANPAAVYKDTVLVRTTSWLYALPFVDPDGSGAIESDEIRWPFYLGQWSGNKWDVALGSGPSAKGGYVYVGTYGEGGVAGSVVKIPISGAGMGNPVWIWSQVGARIQSTPAVGFGYVYVLTMAGPGPSTVKVVAINDATGATQYQKTYTSSNVGRSAPTLADNKVYFWIWNGSPGPMGIWVVALESDLDSPGPYGELYRVQVGTCAVGFGDNGNTPAVAEGWIFAGSGDTCSYPPPSIGFLSGWNS